MGEHYKMARKAAAKSLPMYKRVFFDRTLMAGVVFLCIAYITQNTVVSPFAEAAAFIIGIVWSVRAATTNPHMGFRLAAALLLVLLGLLLAVKLGAADNTDWVLPTLWGS
jgi:hypothetical protein